MGRGIKKKTQQRNTYSLFTPGSWFFFLIVVAYVILLFVDIFSFSYREISTFVQTVTWGKIKHFPVK